MKFRKHIDELCADTLKMNALAQIANAKKGYAGILISSAKIIHTLFSYHLKFDPQNPKWVARDRFILSSYQATPLVYAMLRIINLLSKEDLESFAKPEAKTPFFCNFNTTGIEASTTLPGQGIAISVGLAIAESILSSKFPEAEHYTYVLCNDGDLQEGVAQEALSFAATNKLNKLIVLHDSNGVQADSYTKSVLQENTKAKYRAMGFNFIACSNNVKKINKAIKKAKHSKKPTIISVHTTLGEGTKKANSNLIFQGYLSADELIDFKDNIYFKKADNFSVDEDVKKFYSQKICETNAAKFAKWSPTNKLLNFLNSDLKINLNDLKFLQNQSTAQNASLVINSLAEQNLNLIVGSADSNAETLIKNEISSYAPNNREGRNILFGRRENAMAAIANGIALHSNFRPIISSSLSSFDLMKSPIKAAGMMKLKILYLFNDEINEEIKNASVFTTFDQLNNLRMTSNLQLFKPYDENELKGAFEYYFNDSSQPIAIITNVKEMPHLAETDKAKFKEGAYYILKSKSNPWTLIGSGQELHNLYNIAKKNKISLISSANIQNLEKLNYLSSKAISFESSMSIGWSKLAKFNFGIEDFDNSHSENQMSQTFELNEKTITKKIEKILKAKKS